MTSLAAQSPKNAAASTEDFRVAAMEPFLMGSKYCDVGHSTIQELALRLTSGIDEPVARARAIFEWVRDEVSYVIPHDWSQTASETLAMRRGSCTNKANLLVALARAVGIPAAFEVLRVRGKHYLGPVWIPILQEICDDVSCHVRAAVFLDGRWMKCDPTNDRNLSESIGHLNPPSALALFDGVNDATSFIAPENVLGSLGLIPNGDPILGKRTEKPPIFFTIINCFLEMGRELGPSYHGAVENISPIFDRWMREHYPAEYHEFIATARRALRAAA
jgi:hypothetical protein